MNTFDILILNGYSDSYVNLFRHKYGECKEESMKRLLQKLLIRKKALRKAVRGSESPVRQSMILSFDGRVVRLRMPE